MHIIAGRGGPRSHAGTGTALTGHSSGTAMEKSATGHPRARVPFKLCGPTRAAPLQPTQLTSPVALALALLEWHTTIGRPRSSGWAAAATEAKKQSISTWMMQRSTMGASALAASPEIMTGREQCPGFEFCTQGCNWLGVHMAHTTPGTGSAFSASCGRVCGWLMKLNVQEVDQGLGRVAPST